MAQQKLRGESRVVDLDRDRRVRVEVLGTDRKRTRLAVHEGVAWHIAVPDTGQVEHLASYDRGGNLADVPLPDWLPELLEELGWLGVEV